MRDLERAHERGLRFDVERADYAIGFFRDILRLNGGAFEGRPFVLAPSQAFIVGSLWGWRREDGTRRFRFAYVEEGKGNGKSPLAAGIGLLGMVADGEARAEVYSAATKKDQAMILFRDAVAMVDQSPALRRDLHKSGRGDKVWNLYHAKTNSFFRPLSADSDSQSGPRPHVSLVDELHEHKTPNVINMLDAGKKWRRQPLTFAITNSGSDRESVCYEHHEYARAVCEGSIEDDEFFGYVCALDENDDPFKDESCWVKANPMLGSIITAQYLRDQVTKARGMPSKEALVRRLNFCQWTEGEEIFVAADMWNACRADYGLEWFRGRRCVLAFDLSATQDLTAAVLLAEEGSLKRLWPFFWIPEAGLAERAERDRVPYTVWREKQFVRTTPGAAVNKDFVVADVARALGEHGIELRSAPYDRWRVAELRQACDREGVSLPLVEFGQGFKDMGPAIDAFETAIANTAIQHPGNPVLTWCVSNVVVASDPAGNRKFDKDKARSRIDGAVAAAMAVGQAAREQPSGPKPIQQGFVVID